MRLLVAVVAALSLAAGTAAVPEAVSLDSISATDQQPPAGGDGDTGDTTGRGDASATDEGRVTSAGWGNILWIAIAAVGAVVFVGLAMVGLRGSKRRTPQ